MTADPIDPVATASRSARRSMFLRGLLGGLGFAVLMFVSFPPAGVWWLTLLVPVPLFLAVPCQYQPRLGRWLAMGVGAGVAPMYAAHFVWVTTASIFGYIPLVLYMSAYPALLVLLLHRLRRARWNWTRSALYAALIATGVDFLRGHVVMDGAVLFLPGQPLIESTWFNWVAACGGFFAASLLTWSFGSLIAEAVRQRSRTAGIGAGVLLAVWVGIGAVLSARPGAIDRETVRVGVVQTNVPQDIRAAWEPLERVRSWVRLVELTFLAAGNHDAGSVAGVDVIVWPEGMYPGYTLERDALAAERAESLVWVIEDDRGQQEQIPATLIADELLLLQERVGVPIIVSAIGYNALGFRAEEDGVYYEPDGQFNSVFVVDRPAPPVARYDKMHLTPFGEVMPYISNWTWLETALLAVGAHGMSFNWDAGDSPLVLETPLPGGLRLRLATPVCFEATRGDVCRRLVFHGGKRTADLLVNPTNDIWFDFWDAGRWTHGLISRWRCVELNTPMIRSANSGVSMFIDRRGQITSAGVNVGPHAGGTVNVDGVLLGNTEIGGQATFYARVGDWPGWVGLIAVLAGTLLGFRRGSAKAMPNAAALDLGHED